MTELLYDPSSRQQISRYIDHPAHALIIHGPSGIGKYSTAISIAAQLLGVAVETFQSYPYFRHIAAIESKQISIESIRELEHFLSLKIPGTNRYDRYVIIEQAELLTNEAQNALLKTLEEPPLGTVLLLLTNNPLRLLRTVRSRSREIALSKPARDHLHTYFVDHGYDGKAVQASYTMSGGLPGLMTALLTDSDHPLRQATEVARELLQSTTYQRLSRVDELSKKRQLAEDTVFILQQMSRIRLADGAAANADRWLQILRASYDASQAFAAKSQAKLTLTSLMLNLG